MFNSKKEGIMYKIFVLILGLFFIIEAHAAIRIKDIVTVEGIRDNLLVGYGLVVGLNGTGDNLSNSSFTQKGLVDFLEKLGVNTRGANLKTKNLAAVTLTATLPPFSRQGNKIDVAVSTLGDAKSLQGGTLLATALLGADGEVYGVAQGQVSLGGFSASGKTGTSINKGVTTNGFIPNGAIVEKEINFDFSSMSTIKLSLRNPDMTTAFNISSAINHHLGGKLSKALDSGTVELLLSNHQQENIVTLLSELEQLTIDPDSSAKIIIDEASGTIVMGDNVRISPVAISQGNLTITITEQANISQPHSLSQGKTKETQVSDVSVSDSGKKMKVLDGKSNLHDLVEGLNSLGVGPRDLINILQNIKAVGALQADIENR
jgi:flagellar P-ring protein precursor FlgI